MLIGDLHRQSREVTELTCLCIMYLSPISLIEAVVCTCILLYVVYKCKKNGMGYVYGMKYGISCNKYTRYVWYVFTIVTGRYQNPRIILIIPSEVNNLDFMLIFIR